MTRHLPADGTDFALLECRVDHPDAVSLLRAFYREQVSRYGFAESVDLDPATYAPPHGVFVVAYDRGRPAGCGACRWHDRAAGVVEIKKTFLLPEIRGRGRGRALLDRLESVAVGWGARCVILETGVRNTAALRLFGDTGYRPMPRYVPSRNPSINRAFSKVLAPMAHDQRANVR